MEQVEQGTRFLRALFDAVLQRGQDALLALLPLLPDGAQERFVLWAPVLASLARLTANLRELGRGLSPLLSEGHLDQEALDRFWAELLEEGQTLAEQVPEAERWLDGLELVDGWASRVMTDERGMAVIGSLLVQLESSVNRWVGQIIEAMMAPQAEGQAELWIARLAWAERVVQRFIDKIILPRVFGSRDADQDGPEEQP
jgi:hypothetical protein